MRPLRSLFLALACPGLALTAGCATLRPSPAEPASGSALLAKMHDAFDGQWFHTLTFVQKTTQRSPQGAPVVTTWYEALLAPDRLRIDFGEPADGNGALYTADSLYVMRGGRMVRAIADGNPFLPFVIGVYTQPLDVTMKQLAPYKIDMARVRTDSWRDRPAYVVGSSSSGDLTSPQFWVDRERLVLVRMLLPLIPNGKSPVQDIMLDDYVRTGGGWLATEVLMLDGGQLLQQEDYSDWRTNVPLSPLLFQSDHWRDAPHWRTAPR